MQRDLVRFEGSWLHGSLLHFSDVQPLHTQQNQNPSILQDLQERFIISNVSC